VGLHVLLVEDDLGAAQHLRKIVNGTADMSISHVVRLQDALDALRVLSIDAVVIDIDLAGKPGFDALATVRAAARDAVIVLLAGDDESDEVVARGLREGAHDCLPRQGIDRLLLRRTIRQAMERRRAEETREALFRQLADNIDEAFVILELPQCTALYLSRAWDDIWGVTAEDRTRTPRRWLEAVHDDDQPLLRDAAAAVARGDAVAAVLRVVRPDGSRRWVRARLFPVRDDDGRVYRAAGLITRITDSRHVEQQLVRAQNMESIGRLAGGIAHDFNNLLSVVLGYTELLLNDLGPNDPSAEDIRQIRTAGVDAGTLSRQLVAFGRRHAVKREVVDLYQLISQIEATLRRVAGDVDPVFNLAAPVVQVIADPGQIGQVVVTLAINARDSLPPGSALNIEARTVDVDDAFVTRYPAATTGRYAMITVGAIGAAMDDGTRTRLFEPFVPAMEGGTLGGLELAAVHGIVTDSGGSMWVDQDPARGTTFTIYLPAAEDLKT